MVEAFLEQAPWLTPTSLFLLLNLVIFTILISSTFKKHPRSGDGTNSAASPPSDPPQLARNISLFSRVTLFNFSNYYPEHQHHNNLHNNNSPPSLFSRVTSFNFSGGADEPIPAATEGNVEPKANQKVGRAPYLLSRIASFNVLGRRDPHVEIGEVDAHGKKVVAMKKEVEKETTALRKREEEVDAKADDFISRFKQQLKMQRMESLMRYKSA